MTSGRRAIYAAIVGNFAIAVVKFVAAGISGSAAMLSEGIHSLVDTGNGGLLLLGIKRSGRPPSSLHPFGYGKEVYFYTLIVAILIFGIGGGISIYEGILHVLHPAALGNPTLSYLVLGIALVFEATVWIVALHEFRRVKGRKSFWNEVRTSKDPTTFTVLFEDSAALAGLLVALIGIFIAHNYDAPVFDGLASIGIGLILCAVATLLIVESKGLLLGESMDPAVRESVLEATRRDPDVHQVARMMSMHLGPNEVIVNLDVEFSGHMAPADLALAVRRLEKALTADHPEIKYLTIEVASPEHDAP